MALDTHRIQKAIRRLDKFPKKAPKNPAPDKVHKVRTSIRRIEESNCFTRCSPGTLSPLCRWTALGSTNAQTAVPIDQANEWAQSLTSKVRTSPNISGFRT